MAILKRRSISITHEYEDVHEFLKNSKYNLSKYVCDLIRADIEENKRLYGENSNNNQPTEKNSVAESKDEEEKIEEIQDNNSDNNNDNIEEIDASWL